MSTLLLACCLFKEVLRFWLDRGVDGFRVDAIQTLFEDENLLDEPLSGVKGFTSVRNSTLTKMLITTFAVVNASAKHFNCLRQILGFTRGVYNGECGTCMQFTFLWFWLLQEEHEYLSHPYTLHQDEIHEVVREWRTVIDEHNKESGKET